MQKQQLIPPLLQWLQIVVLGARVVSLLGISYQELLSADQAKLRLCLAINDSLHP